MHSGLKPNIDNIAFDGYSHFYWFCLIESSVSGARADADTKLTVFDSSALKKPLIIF